MYSYTDEGIKIWMLLGVGIGLTFKLDKYNYSDIFRKRYFFSKNKDAFLESGPCRWYIRPGLLLFPRTERENFLSARGKFSARPYLASLVSVQISLDRLTVGSKAIQLWLNNFQVRQMVLIVQLGTFCANQFTSLIEVEPVPTDTSVWRNSWHESSYFYFSKQI